MVGLNNKQLHALAALSDELGNRKLDVETVPKRALSGYLTFAYVGRGVGERGWLVTQDGRLRELKLA